MAFDFSGKVVGITDGDTISVLHDRRAEKIRLDGIDCPESHQAFGTKAKHFTSELTFGKTVTVKVKEKDKYGRTVGEVILQDGRSVNRELVQSGLAWWYRKYSTDQSLGDLEAQAKAAYRGLWADQDPTPPWDFRQNKGVKVVTSDLINQQVVQVEEGASSELLEPGSYQVVQVEEGARSELLKPGSFGKINRKTEKKETTVFITRTGKKYHTGGCRHLSKSSIPISQKNAIAAGYTSCSVCRPAQQ
jgi:endonuclease YncB( thermonuclease family)